MTSIATCSWALPWRAVKKKLANRTTEQKTNDALKPDQDWVKEFEKKPKPRFLDYFRYASHKVKAKFKGELEPRLNLQYEKSYARIFHQKLPTASKDTITHELGHMLIGVPQSSQIKAIKVYPNLKKSHAGVVYRLSYSDNPRDILTEIVCSLGGIAGERVYRSQGRQFQNDMMDLLSASKDLKDVRNLLEKAKDKNWIQVPNLHYEAFNRLESKRFDDIMKKCGNGNWVEDSEQAFIRKTFQKLEAFTYEPIVQDGLSTALSINRVISPEKRVQMMNVISERKYIGGKELQRFLAAAITPEEQAKMKTLLDEFVEKHSGVLNPISSSPS